MDNDILFSIIVPVYNTEKYINKCLASIKNAMELDCEVIIINDGSTDNSEKVIKEFINNLPEEYKNNFTYKSKENKGLADTKNVGIELAKGKYISVIDSDDYISDDFYNIARRYIKEGYEIIVYDLYVVYEKRTELEFDYVGRAFNDEETELMTGLISGAMQGSSCNKIIKRDLYKPYKFPINKEYEDASVTPFILMDAEKIKYIPYPLYYYLQREKSIVASNTFISAFYKICDNLSEQLENRKDYTKYDKVINEFFVKRMLETVYQDYKKSRKNFNKNMINFAEKNEKVINYILDKKLIYLDNKYSERQRKTLEKVLIDLKERKIKNIRKLFWTRRFINYIRRIYRGFIDLIKIILGRI